MEIINEIKVLDKGFVRLVDHMGDDAAIVQSARVSYGKGTKTVNEDEGLIRYLMRHGHTTPFEMVQYKFHVRAPIFVIRQWHRHRMWSYNEMSGRYSEMPEDCYVPHYKKITLQSKTNKQGGSEDIVLSKKCYSEIFEEEQIKDKENYQHHLATGMRKELARINLPLAQYSEMYASVDLHNLFHFLRLRLDSHAQYEIQVYGEAIAQFVKELNPIAWKAFEDYQVNSIKLSGPEQKALKELLHHNAKTDILDQIARDTLNNSREKQEFIDKIKKILGE